MAETAHRREAEFFGTLLRDYDTRICFDIGANLGFKTALFARCDCRVIAVEPDPDNFRQLRRRFGKTEKVSLVKAGAGAEAGRLLLKRFEGTSTAFNTFSEKWISALKDGSSSRFGAPMKVQEQVNIEIVTLDALILHFGMPDFVKIDVEGYEFEVLKGLSVPISLVSIECNLPEFADETVECIRRLQGLDREYRFNFTLDEPPTQFACKSWKSGEEIIALVSDGQHRFMEIYARRGMRQQMASKEEA